MRVYGFLLLLFFLFCVKTKNDKTSLIWMCLERCEDTKEEISKQLDIIQKVAPKTLTSISFEIFNLGEGGTLVENNLTAVYKDKRLTETKNVYGKKLELWPMLSSFPYPPEFIDYMRDLFKNPDPFINDCIKYAKKYGFKGYNVDFEPTKGIKEGDDEDYAKFLTYFAEKLHAENMQLSVDTARWTTLWNYPLLNKTKTDRILHMQTYTYKWSTWMASFDYAKDNISQEKLGIGLCYQCGSEFPLTDEEIQMRFDYINAKEALGVDIWRMNSTILHENCEYWKQLENFFKN